MSFENMTGFFKPEPSEQPNNRPFKRDEREDNGTHKCFSSFLNRLRGSSSLFKGFDMVDIVGCSVIGSGLIAVVCTWSRFMDALFVHIAFPLLKLISSIVGICVIVLVPLLFVASRIDLKKRSSGISKWFRW